MFENELQVYIDFHPDHDNVGYIKTVNPDGTFFLIETRDKSYPSSWLNVPNDDFEVQFLSDNGDPEFKNWEKELPVLIDYAKKMKKELAIELCSANETHNLFTFKLCRFHETRGNSSQTDQLMDKHEGWYYFEFDENNDQVYRVEKFKEIAESKFVYNSTDRDWPETQIFFKDLLPENMDRSFQYLIGLRKASAELSDLWDEVIEQYSWSNPWEYLDERPTA
jgi:hypothetical protein